MEIGSIVELDNALSLNTISWLLRWNIKPPEFNTSYEVAEIYQMPERYPFKVGIKLQEYMAVRPELVFNQADFKEVGKPMKIELNLGSDSKQIPLNEAQLS